MAFGLPAAGAEVRKGYRAPDRGMEKAGRIGLRHGPAGGKQAGTAGQKAAGPLHAQAMVQKLQREPLGLV